MTPLYWMGNGANFSSASWATSSGGATGHAAPTSTDDAIFDANSPGNCTVDVSSACATLTCTGFTHTLTFTAALTVSPTVNATGVVFATGMTIAGTAALTISGTGTNTYVLTSAGRSMTPAITLSNASGATLALQDDLSGAIVFSHITGIFDANGHNVTVRAYQSGVGGNIHMGSGTWTLTSNGNVFQISASATVVCGTSTLTFTDTTSGVKTLSGGSHVFFNVTIPGGGTGAVAINGSNTFNAITISGPKTITVQHGTTNTIASLSATGSTGNVITFQSDSAGSTYTLSCPTVVSCDWLSVTDSIAAGKTPFFAGHNSTLSNTTNWVAAVPFSPTAADTSSSSDSASRATLAFARAVTDSSTSSDVGIRAPLARTRTSTDGSLSSDATVRSRPLARATTDSSLSSDTSVRFWRFVRSADDSSVTTDAASRTVTRPKAAFDSSRSSDSARVIRFVGHAFDVSISADMASARLILPPQPNTFRSNVSLFITKVPSTQGREQMKVSARGLRHRDFHAV